MKKTITMMNLRIPPSKKDLKLSLNLNVKMLDVFSSDYKIIYIIHSSFFFGLALKMNKNLFRFSVVFFFFSQFRWEFRTFDHDIRFGIKRVHDKSGEQNIEIDMKRVASHQLDEEGFITCQPDWTCKYIDKPKAISK